MAQVASQHQPHSSHPSPASVHEHHEDAPLPAAPPPPSNGPAGKKTKSKKGAADTTDAHKQLQAKIAQLEQDATGRAEEDAEIGVFSMTVTCYIH
jgi:hypothetical protein